jgi:hypothetical protein
MTRSGADFLSPYSSMKGLLSSPAKGSPPGGRYTVGYCYIQCRGEHRGHGQHAGNLNLWPEVRVVDGWKPAGHGSRHFSIIAMLSSNYAWKVAGMGPFGRKSRITSTMYSTSSGSITLWGRKRFLLRCSFNHLKIDAIPCPARYLESGIEASTY